MEAHELRRRLAAIATPLTIALAALAIGSPAASSAPPRPDVDQPAVYLEPNAGSPWGDAENAQAMDDVFEGAWNLRTFETVDTGTDADGLFGPNVKTIFMDGGNEGGPALVSFLAENESKLVAFVERGGGLFINAAVNEEPAEIGFDGHRLVYRNDSDVPILVEKATSQPRTIRSSPARSARSRPTPSSATRRLTDWSSARG